MYNNKKNNNYPFYSTLKNSSINIPYNIEKEKRRRIILKNKGFLSSLVRLKDIKSNRLYS